MLTTTIMKIWTLYLLVKTILYASLLPKRRLNNGTKSKHLKGHSGLSSVYDWVPNSLPITFSFHLLKISLFRCASISSTYPGQSVVRS